MRGAWLLFFVVVAGCATPTPSPAPEPFWVGPPDDGGGFAPCASRSAQELAIPGLRATVTDDDQGRGPGLHLIDERTLLYVWANYVDSPRDDHITRLNRIEVHRETDGSIIACTRIEIVAPLFTDGSRDSYTVAAMFTAPDGWPRPLHAVVNWVAGCTPCDPAPRGNATGDWP